MKNEHIILKKKSRLFRELAFAKFSIAFLLFSVIMAIYKEESAWLSIIGFIFVIFIVRDGVMYLNVEKQSKSKKNNELHLEINYELSENDVKSFKNQVRFLHQEFYVKNKDLSIEEKDALKLILMKAIINEKEK